MTSFKVTVLGSGSAMPVAGRHNSAHVVNVHEQLYLIDCGEATQVQLRRFNIPLLKINAVFITHMHGDHVFGLPGLISTMNFLGRRTPLYIYGVAPLGEMIDTHKRLFDNELGYDIIYTEINAREHKLIFENKVLEVFTIPLRHRVPCSGFLFREKEPGLNVRKDMIERHGLSLTDIVALKRGEDWHSPQGTVVPNSELTYRPYTARSYAYLSDTQYSAKAAGLVSGVNLLYHEATYLDSEKKLAAATGHSTAQQAAKAATVANARCLMLGHFSSRYKDETVFTEDARTVFPNVILAKEGETTDIKQERE